MIERKKNFWGLVEEGFTGLFIYKVNSYVTDHLLVLKN